MKIAALLTGKGSSTLKNKNLLKINNKPILYYPCAEAKKIKDIDKFFVSSEDKKILDICNKYGYEKILRPKNLSKANSKHHDVILHSVKYMKNKNYHPDILIILLANAPIISSKWIKDCLKILRNNKKTTSVVPVILNNDHNPFRAKKLRGNYLKNFYKIKKKYHPIGKTYLIVIFFVIAFGSLELKKYINLKVNPHGTLWENMCSPI